MRPEITDHARVSSMTRINSVIKNPDGIYADATNEHRRADERN